MQSFNEVMQQTDVLVQVVEPKKKSQELCDHWCVISRFWNSYKAFNAQYSSRKSVKGLLIKNVGRGYLTKYSVARILDFSRHRKSRKLNILYSKGFGFLSF